MFLGKLCGLCRYYAYAVVFHIFCEPWILEWHIYDLVAFAFQFRSFWYIIRYFSWLVQGVLVYIRSALFFISPYFGIPFLTGILNQCLSFSPILGVVCFRFSLCFSMPMSVQV